MVVLMMEVMLMSRGSDRSLNFVVHGDKITELARDRYKESKDVNDGIDFLCGMLIGFPRDIAEEVVKGSKKLVGVNEVYLEDDDTEVVPYGYIQPSDISSVECGWISPDGLCFGDPHYNSRDNHILLSKAICERYYPDSKNDDFTLEDEGWIKLCPYRATMYAVKGATEAQKDTLVQFCRSHGRRIELGGLSGEFYSANDIQNMDLLTFNKHI